MTTTRPTLKLDEKSFQELLAAAFTIQEHNDKVSKTAATRPNPEPVSAIQPQRVVPIKPDGVSAAKPEPVSAGAQFIRRFCPHCAAPLQEGDTQCSECGLDEFRSGERMQRKFASLWEMSQGQGVRHERVPDSVLELASSAPVPAVTKNDVGRARFEEETAALQEAPTFNELAEIEGPVLADESDSAVPGAVVGADGPLRELWRRLNLATADVYLGVAIVVAVLAILWPAPASLHNQGLQPWQRILITLGVAEAPPPQPHYRGDPNLEVWVDPHTALYYCPGEEQYGKSANGRLEAQREAQVDQFEPAGRAACQ